MTDPGRTVAKPARRSILAAIGPGILVAATGVGAGDLATASFAGSQLGTAVLWAVVVGAFLKFVLNEGLARWQLATGDTLIEGAMERMPAPLGYAFLAYFVVWTFFVGSALISACGVTLHAMLPLFADPVHGKIGFGILASLLGLALALSGGFRLFEKVMSTCIALMFVTVVATAVVLWPSTADVLNGLFVPRIPDLEGEGLAWTVALLGGVGGTLTILCYGYWIREEGRSGRGALSLCRLDLGLGYAMTALFGLAMVIVGSAVDIAGSGAGLLVALADGLEEPLGTVGRWLFLVGVLGAVFSSLLGVWQSVPYLFADIWALSRRSRSAGVIVPVDTASRPYRAYLWAIAIVPMLGLFVSFREMQKLYAITGATFIPILACALLVMNGRRAWVGESANRWPTVLVLIATLLLFCWFGWMQFAG